MTAINSVLGGKSRPGGTAVATPNSVLNCAWMIIASSFHILGLWIRVEGAGGGAEMEMEKEEGNREILDEDVCGGGSLLVSHADDWNRDPWMSFRMSVREMVLGSCLSFLFTRNCVKFNLGSKLCFSFGVPLFDIVIPFSIIGDSQDIRNERDHTNSSEGFVGQNKRF